jgi:formylglycine-generating enzyme required for sulfatase activity
MRPTSAHVAYLRAMDILTQLDAYMVAIAGGTFTMGNDAQLRERPAHAVQVADFMLSKYLVTQAQWSYVMGSNPSHFQHDPACPVDQVSWEMAMEFIHQLHALTGLSYRLPTENEWEFAARGGLQSQGYNHAGSNDLATVAWYNGNSQFRTHPVGLKLPNELGLYDMNGNVWEWCADRVPKDYAQPHRIPTWEENADSNDRILRGGSYINYAIFSRCSYRWEDRPDNVENYIGLRLAR